MITMTELECGFTVPKEHKSNLLDLFLKINLLAIAYGQSLTVNSGYRSLAHHKAIYKAKGILTPPLGSNHLIGRAVDISDPDGRLMNWVLSNIPFMEKTGLWMEEPDSIPRVHFQTIPPKSGKRFFKP